MEEEEAEEGTTLSQEEEEEERASAATSVALVEGGHVYPDTYGPWRVCCRCLERIGDPNDDGLDAHGGICSLGMVFEQCWTCEGLCHVHGALNGPECRGLRCRAGDGGGGPPPGPCQACGTSPPCRTCMAASASAHWPQSRLALELGPCPTRGPRDVGVPDTLQG